MKADLSAPYCFWVPVLAAEAAPAARAAKDFLIVVDERDNSNCCRTDIQGPDRASPCENARHNSSRVTHVRQQAHS